MPDPEIVAKVRLLITTEAILEANVMATQGIPPHDIPERVIHQFSEYVDMVISQIPDMAESLRRRVTDHAAASGWIDDVDRSKDRTPEVQAIRKERLQDVEIPHAEKRKRLLATIFSPIAAHRMEEYLTSNGIGQTEFAGRVGTTERTLRSFRTTGKIRRDIFTNIATEMGTTVQALLKAE